MDKIILGFNGSNFAVVIPVKAKKLGREITNKGGTWSRLVKGNPEYSLSTSLDSVRFVVGLAKSNGLKLSATKQAKERIKKLTDNEKLDAARDKIKLNGIEEEAPLIFKSVRDYQKEGIKFLNESKQALLADDPGTGKTLQTIGAIIESGIEGDILVLAPSAAAQVTWPAELAHWVPGDEVIAVYGSKKKKQEKLAELTWHAKTKRRWIVTNFESIRIKYHESVTDIDDSGNVFTSKGWYEYIFPEFFFFDHKESKNNIPRPWSAIVVDESHQVLPTKNIAKHKQTQVRCGLSTLKTKPGAPRIAISGTPFRGKVENMWGTLNWLYPDKWDNFYDWADYWLSSEMKTFQKGGEVKQAKTYGDIDPAKTNSFYDELEPIMLRRSKAEVVPELPPKTYAGTFPKGMEDNANPEWVVGHWLPMSPKQKRAYDQMVEEAIAHLESGVVVANGVLAELTRCKQFACCYGSLSYSLDSDGVEKALFEPALPSNKFDWILEFLEELNINRNNDPNVDDPDSRKVVIVSQFTQILDLLDLVLTKKKIKSVKITGKVNGKERKKAQEEFQSDRGARVMLLNVKSGGVSLTLDRADDLVIIDETFIPDDQEQVENRIHRVSRMHNVTIHYLRSIDTIDYKIACTTGERNEILKAILDESRGIETAKELLING